MLTLASASPARLATLRAAGINPRVVVSGVDETLVDTADPAEAVARLAQLKAEAVAERLRRDPSEDGLVLGCDSLLELGGEVLGKPAGPDEVSRRWVAMGGKSGVLHTGHCLIGLDSGRSVVRSAATRVHFAAVTAEEIRAYVDSGEPLAVAGGFTLDGLGGAFVSGIEGDPHNVVGLSLPLLRLMCAELGIVWTHLWNYRLPGRPE